MADPDLVDDLTTASAELGGPLRALTTMSRDQLRHLIHLSERQSHFFTTRGDPYVHGAVPEPAFACLDDGSCWSRYLTALDLAAERQFTSPPPTNETDRINAMVAAAGNGKLIKLLHESERRGVAEVERYVHASVVLLSNGHAAEAKQAAALEEAERLMGRSIDHATFDLRSHPELGRYFGTRLVAAAIVGGRLRKDLTTAAQWLELLGSDAAIPRLARKQSDLPLIDAHVHVVNDGAGTYARMVDRGGVAGAAVMPLPDDVRYSGLDAANERSLAAASKLGVPAVPFVIVSPNAPDPAADLERWLARGARGLKLLSGHGSYFEANGGVLDPPKMRALFALCEARGVPIVWHVNTPLYPRGFLRVLADFPRATIVSPHLGGYLTYAPGIVRELLTRYPNLYFDVSFGAQVRYLRRAFEDLSLQRDAWRQLFLDFPDRFLFGVDMVVDRKSAVSHALMLYTLYTKWLEEESFDLDFFAPEGYGAMLDEPHHVRTLHGLALPRDVLRKVYAENAQRLFGIPRR